MMKNFISTLFVFSLFIGFSFAQDSSVANETDVSACVLGTVYITEAHGKGDPEDYIEIYNAGDTDCSMLGFMLDDEQPFDDFTFGDVIIPAGAYWMGEEDAEGSFGSGIGGGGDNLYLGDTLGNILMVESLDGDLGATNFTADGAGCSAEPTPGTLNAECTVFVEGCTDEAASNYNPEANLDAGCEYPVIVSSCVLGVVYITEAHGKGDPEDYIEIYNAGDADCSMLGFQLDDEQPFGDFTFADVIIPAGGYWLGEEDAEGSFSSGIGGGGDNLYLGDTLGNVLMVESLDGDLGATNFTADGAGCSAEPTPGTSNVECTVFIEGCTDEAALNYNPDANLNTGCEYPVIVSSCVLGVVYISEAHGSGDPEDYIEIYNSGDTDCSMLGFMLDDEQPFTDFTFGDVIISAGAYWLGEEDAEGSFSSGIGGGGDNLYLGDTLGNVLTVESFNGDFGATNFTADGAGCSAEPSPGAVNTACTIFDQGCLDANASNYNPGAIEQEYDQWNNTLCTYSSCDDVPSEGCMYSDAFAAWNEWFDAADCSTYGGTPCELDPCGDACAYNEICVNGSCEEIIPVATGLPIVYINTENQTSIKVKTEGYVNGVVTVVGGESIKSGSMINGLDSKTMEIRGRGNSTWMHPKKPYQMKLEDKAEFLDMPNDKKWLFLAEYSDKTMLRNTMAFEMGYASSLDWTPAGEFAEVYINGEYNGTYNITQKVEAKSNRVDIGDDGFLLEIDQIERLDADDHYVSTNEFPVINIKEPDINDIIEDDGVGKADSAVTKISTFINEFETALFGNNFTDTTSGYAKYIDVESFIDWFLISEILKNVDSRSFSSIYFHVIFDENDQGKMKMGPLWDFDLSFGNTNYADSQYPEGWWVRNNPWISRLMNDPIFKEQVITRFEDHFYARKGIILDKINTYSNALAASAVQNDNQWGPYIGSYVWPNPNVGDLSTGNSGIQGYNDAVNNITDWYEQRMEWLKENFWSLEACTDANASNFEVTAITQTYDQWGNSTCIYASCDDIPDAEGCSYTDAYSPFHEGFNAEDCEQYGGTACTGGSADVEGCVDANASNYDANATIQTHDQHGNSTCIYASCDDIPDAEGCSYASAYSPFNEGFNAANCVTYGGTACVDDTNVTSVDVTFQVDMSAVDTHEEGVYLAGGDLGQDGYLMDHNGNDIWSITITLEPNRTYIYKFRNQPSYGTWDGFEAQAGLIEGGCSTGDWDDRFVEVAESDIVLDLVSYGSCTADGLVDVSGCMDSNATNYNAAATDQAQDQWGNILCVYASCDDIPELGCIYAESFAAFHESFDGAACSNYGGTPCEGGSTDVEGCVDANASNYDTAATIQEYDQWNNLVCVYASCNDIPDAEGCFYAEAYSPFHDGFNAANCVAYGGTACVDETNITSVDVTFQVDMSAVETHAEGVYLAGGGFGQDGYLLTDDGNDVWRITLTLDANQTYMYKFRNQPSYGTWDGFEAQAGLIEGGCSTGDWDDRFVEVAESDIVLALVSYGSCTLDGSFDLFGCMDANATNYDAAATVQAVDQYSNALCVYASCDDIPDAEGCVYEDAYAPYNEYFTPENCTTYGGTACVEETADVEGCLDANATNYDAAATVQAQDQWANALCVYASCDDIPDAEGCIYADAYAPYNEYFTPENCTTYGGTACVEETADVVGCLDANATNYDAAATVQAVDQYNNQLCTYASCDDVPSEGCMYADAFSGWNEWFGPAECSNYGGTPCEGSTSGGSGCLDSNATNYDAAATIQAEDQWGNLVCVYTSCDTAPSDGCVYAESFGVFVDGFGPAECSNYGGTPCEGGSVDVEGCLDANATNYNAVVTVQAHDQWGNQLCTYASCDDVPSDGCMYSNAFAGWNDYFGPSDCSGYGGTPCEGTTNVTSGCTDPMALNYNANATVDDGTCDYPCSTAWAVTITDQNHSIFITGSWTDVNGAPLADGSLLGVFYEDADENLVCAGYTEIAEGTVQIAAMGDDVSTEEIDGLLPDQELEYHVWDASTCEEFSADITYSGGPEVYTSNGITFISSVVAAPFGPNEQHLNFVSGWSIFSTYMIPSDLDITSVLAPIVDHLVIAKDYSGLAYLPAWDFNGIGSIEVGQAYQVKTSVASELTIGGAYAFPEENPIEFGAGWNMIGYLRTDAVAADLVLAELVAEDNLIIAKNSLGLAYLPEWNFNGIGEMLPGEGYQIKTNTSGTLQYLSNDAYYRISSLEVTENNVSHFAKVPATDNNMTVIIEDAAWDVLPTEGSEIAAFDKTGHMIGSAIYSSPVTAIAVWGDDATTSSKDGLEASEAVSFKVWASGEVRDFTVKEWAEGSSSYNVDAINIASTIETNHVIADINSTERVLVKVINVLGQEVILNNDSFKGKVLFNIYNDGTVEKVVK